MEWARQHRMPEMAVPESLVSWMLQGHIEDNLEPLKFGLRYSPQAIRTMITAFMCGIYHPDQGYIGPKSFQAALNAGIYGLFNDFIDPNELNTLMGRRVLRTDLCEDHADILTQQHPLFHSRVYGTMEGASLDPKWLRPGACKIFFNGTWNGFPHPGHMLYLDATLGELNMSQGIPCEKMVVMVACEQNQEIEHWGKVPFCDTVARASLMSYVPYVDLVAPSGSWGEGGDPDLHWQYKLGLIKPDFISVEVDDPFRERKTQRAEALGIKVLTNYRHGAWMPHLNDDGTLTMEKQPGNVLSSTNLMNDNVADLENGPDFRLTQPINHLMAKKQIRDMLYGRREWFSNQAGI